jgi:hypothetical protein
VLVLAVALVVLQRWWSVVPSADSTKPNSAASSKAGNQSDSAATGANKPANAPLSRKERVEEILSAINHKPIEFYGKVVDQGGAPLANVLVHASVIHNNGITAGLQKAQTTTNVAGLFSIQGMQGRTLGIGLEKQGYEYGGEHGPFQFTEFVPETERYHPDSKNPVVFVMRKLQGAEPMVFFERKAFDLPADGVPVQIDLATAKKVSSGGDLTFSLVHPLAPRGQWLERYPWEVQISAAGLSESTEKLMYLAPEAGYVSKLLYGEKGDEADERRQLQRSFYVRISNNCFARVKMDLHTQTNPSYPSYVVLTWWLNPSPGHRNLEFDPERVTSTR